MLQQPISWVKSRLEGGLYWSHLPVYTSTCMTLAGNNDTSKRFLKQWLLKRVFLNIFATRFLQLKHLHRAVQF